MFWTVVGALAAIVAAVTGAWLWWWAWRDRSAKLTILVTRDGRAKEQPRFVICEIRMSRGPTIVLHKCGVRLQDGRRQALNPCRGYSDVTELPCALSPHDRVAVGLYADEVWQWLVRSHLGATDVDVSFYVEDGAGVRYDWPEWVTANATTRKLELEHHQ